LPTPSRQANVERASPLAGFGLCFAPAADAGVVGANGRFIRVTKTDGTVNPADANRFHIGEIEALAVGATPGSGLDTANDFALGSLGASGATIDGTPQHGAESALVNGVVDGGGATWSRQGPLPIVAQVDLGQSRDLSSIRVWQRGDGSCQERLESFDVQFLADDGGGNPGAVVHTWPHPGRVVPTNGSSAFALLNAEFNPGPVGGIGNDDTLTTVESSPVVVNGAKRARLVQNVSNTFQIAEIEALEEGTGTNVALQANGGVATALNSGYGTNPGRANDGDLRQNYPNLWHSTSGQGTWVQVEFAAAANLEAFHIYGRSDCCHDRQDDFDLVLYDAGGTEVHRQQVVGLGSSPGQNQQFDLATETGRMVGELYSMHHTFEIDADALAADTVTVPNSDPAYSTVLDVNGVDLQFEIINGDAFSLIGETLQVLIADEFTGDFASITPPTLLPAMRMDASNLLIDGTVAFQAPEPSSLVLAVVGLLGLSLYAWRRRRRA